LNKLKQKFIKIVESDHNLYEQVLNRKHIETLGNKFTEATKDWLKQKRDEYTDNLTYPLGQRVLIGTFFIGLLEDLEK